jgi:hypothetical protein
MCILSLFHQTHSGTIGLTPANTGKIFSTHIEEKESSFIMHSF